MWSRWNADVMDGETGGSDLLRKGRETGRPDHFPFALRELAASTCLQVREVCSWRVALVMAASFMACFFGGFS